MQGFVTEQLDIFSLAPVLPKKRNILIRWAQETDMQAIQSFIGKPLETRNFVILEDEGVEFLGVVGWDTLDGFTLLHQPVMAELEDKYGWCREELLRLSCAGAEHKTNIEYSVYTFAAELDVPFLKRRGYVEVEDLPDGLIADKGRLMVKGNRANYEMFERLRTIGIGRVAKFRRG